MTVLALVLSLIYLNIAEADGSDMGRVVVLSDPVGLEVLLDGQSSGRTPLEIEVDSAGKHSVLVRHPLDRNWPARDMEFKIEVEPFSSDTVFARFDGILFVNSGPSPTEVYLDGDKVGETPILIRGLNPGSHMLESLTAGYGVGRRDSLEFDISPGEFKRISLPHTAPASMSSPEQDKGLWLGHNGKLAFSSALIAVSSGVGAYFAKKTADRNYERYLNSGDPEKMNHYFKRAERYDRIASGMWALSEIGLVVTFYFAIF